MPASAASATTEMRAASAATASAMPAATAAASTAAAATPSGCRRRTRRCRQSDHQNNHRTDFESAHDTLRPVGRSQCGNFGQMRTPNPGAEPRFPDPDIYLGLWFEPYQAVLPASIVSTLPVMLRPPSPSRYSTMLAMSSGSASRRKALRPLMRLR